MSGAPTVAIIGRPNVGKSTLFNRIIGRPDAIVDAQPGVTRDRHFAPAEWNGRRFWLVDTGGLVPEATDQMHKAVRTQVDLAIAESDVLLFVVDVAAGVHPADREIAELVRKAQRPFLVVANKADELPVDSRHLAFYELGLGDPVPVSAAVGKNSGDLLDCVVELLPPTGAANEEAAIHVAVVGRPNVGKSSLVNRLLGEDRMVVAAEPGTTRDAIDTRLVYHERTIVFIDTAGLRKRSKVTEDLEFYATLRTARAIERAEVCVLVVDASDGMHTQDLKIATQAWEHGAGLIVAVNKWDLIEEKDANTGVEGERALRERAPFLEVNRVLEELVGRHQPPQPVGESVRLLYASQIGTAPPRFAIVSNRPEAVPESYTRYLVNGFREAWAFTGSPLNLKLRRRRETARG